MGHRLLAILFFVGASDAVAPISRNHRDNLARLVGNVAGHKGEVATLHAVQRHQRDEVGAHPLATRHEDEAGGILVETVNAMHLAEPLTGPAEKLGLAAATGRSDG